MRCCLIQQRKITISPSSLHVYMPLTVDTCCFVCENGKSVIFHPNSSLINDLVRGFFQHFHTLQFDKWSEVFHALTLILPVFRSARSVHRRLVQVSMLFFMFSCKIYYASEMLIPTLLFKCIKMRTLKQQI